MEKTADILPVDITVHAAPIPAVESPIPEAAPSEAPAEQQQQQPAPAKREEEADEAACCREPPQKRGKLTKKSDVVSYFKEANRHTIEADLFEWKTIDDVRDSEGFKILGGIEYHRCKLLKTLDPEDPYMQAGCRIQRIRLLPASSTWVFFPKKDARLARLFRFDMGALYPVVFPEKPQKEAAEKPQKEAVEAAMVPPAAPEQPQAPAVEATAVPAVASEQPQAPVDVPAKSDDAPSAAQEAPVAAAPVPAPSTEGAQ